MRLGDESSLGKVSQNENPKGDPGPMGLGRGVRILKRSAEEDINVTWRGAEALSRRR